MLVQMEKGSLQTAAKVANQGQRQMGVAASRKIMALVREDLATHTQTHMHTQVLMGVLQKY